MKREKSQQVKERNAYIVSLLKSTKGTEKYKEAIQELITKYGIGIKQINRINSKLMSHPVENDFTVHTKNWWITNFESIPEWEWVRKSIKRIKTDIFH